MQVALLSDIHSNSEALAAIDPWLDGVDEIFVLGDVIGYGADPALCLAWVIRRHSTCLLGNHDAACTGALPLSWFSPQARRAVEWTRQQISSSLLSFLEYLPQYIDRLGALWVHGSPRNPLEEYISNRSVAGRIFTSHDFSLCFYGHTHVAEAYVLERNRLTHKQLNQGGEIHLEEDRRYLINCGSVGQPRDGNPQASFGLLDTERKTVRVVRVDYDQQQAASKILQAGLPEVLAYRLFEGF
ncbi:MAG TPA: metallophosphoesterase family protein [Atribacteraceae bacterium]|nr:metallophosphoesterase family protein [Atribacteraceae bacterium]